MSNLFEEFNRHEKESNISAAIEEGCKPCVYDGLSLPIALTSIFQMRTNQNKNPSGYVYSRVGNLTVDIVEKQINKLYRTNRYPDDKRRLCTLSFPSGMAAVSSTLWCLIERDDHVLISNEVYKRIYTVLEHLQKFSNVSFNVVDIFNDLEDVRKKIQKGKTRFLFFDSCSNPTMKIPDFPNLMKICKEEGGKRLVTVCDNTWMSSVLFNPFDWGVDVIVESGSKYLSGSSSTIFGFVTTKDSELFLKLNRWRTIHGHAVHPFASYMISKGIDTLVMRMNELSRRGLEIANFLDSLPCVSRTLYPFHKGHFHHRRALEFFKGGSGVIFFHAMMGLPLSEDLVSFTKLIIRSTSYGSSHFMWDTSPKIGNSYDIDRKNLGSKCSEVDDVRSVTKIKGCWFRFAIGFSNLDDIKHELLSAFGRCCGLNLGRIKKLDFKSNSIVIVEKNKGPPALKSSKMMVFSLLELEKYDDAMVKRGDFIYLSNFERDRFKIFQCVKVKNSNNKKIVIEVEPKLEKSDLDDFQICLKLKDWRDLIEETE